MAYSMKHLDEATLKKVQVLEGKIGATIVAYEKGGPEADDITEDKMRQIQLLEKDISAVLVAYKK